MEGEDIVSRMYILILEICPEIGVGNNGGRDSESEIDSIIKALKCCT